MKNSKNIAFLVSGIIGGSLIAVDIINTSQICFFLNHVDSINCMREVFDISMIFYIFPFVFLFSLITYFLKEEIFKAWSTFTYFWVPVAMIFVFIMPSSSGGGFFPSLLDKQLIAILMSGLYLIISLIIVIYKVVQVYFFKKVN